VQAALQCQGRTVVSGIGKSGHIGRKIAATLASTGTPRCSCIRPKPPMATWAW
jgi:D-arabinose 5-phosphate isomerase GutQ